MLLNKTSFTSASIKFIWQISRNLSNQPIRRGVLYVPGDNQKHITKALNLPEIDCIVFDCEDGVAHNRKNVARSMIKEHFEQNIAKEKACICDLAVRVNSVSSGIIGEDLKILFSGTASEKWPKTLFLPKVNSVDDLKEFSSLLKKSLGGSAKSEPTNLIIYSESCESVLNLREICQKAKDLSKSDGIFQPAGIVFGSDDFLANLGASRDVTDSTNILYARQKVVLTAKAFGLQAIDMVYINFKDLDGLKSQSIEGAKMGYTGKQIIHPDQIKIVQNSFLPTLEQINWARGCVAAYEDHQKCGKGAFVYKNQMIDNPTVEQARNILKLGKQN